MERAVGAEGGATLNRWFGEHSDFGRRGVGEVKMSCPYREDDVSSESYPGLQPGL